MFILSWTELDQWKECLRQNNAWIVVHHIKSFDEEDSHVSSSWTVWNVNGFWLSAGDLGKAVSELVTVMTDEDGHSESASPSDEELHTSARFNPK
jgi:hypothetical protein